VTKVKLTIADSASPADLKEIHALLRGAGLMTEGVEAGARDFLVGREDGRIVAVAGLEDYTTAGLLRSVAVAPDRRDRGLAQTLIKILISRSKNRGHHAIYLFTDTAAGYFSRFGFRRIDRTELAPDIMGSDQFKNHCASSAVMVLEFPGLPTDRQEAS
jgi:amino-acid N-acetyltransferase